MGLLIDSWAPGFHRKPEDYEWGKKLRAMSVEEHVDRLIAFSGVDLTDARDRFFALEGRKLELLEATPEVQRLAYIRQNSTSSDREPGWACEHTRYDHSRSGAGAVIATGLRLGLEDRVIGHATFAMLMHDIGHPVLSHPVDNVLKNRGFNDHEARGYRLVEVSNGIQVALTISGLRSDDILPIMKEEGTVGTRQSIFDTLSYIELDSAMFGVSLPKDFAWRVIASIIGESREGLRVNDTAPLQELLEHRARLYRTIYCSPRGRVNDSVIEHLAHMVIEHTVVSPTDFMKKRDDEVVPRMEDFVANGASDYHKCAWRLVGGYPDDLAEYWKMEVYEIDFGFIARIHELRKLNHPYIACPRYYHAKKVITVIGPDGKVDLKAKSRSKNRLDDVSFILVYNG